MSHSGFCAFCRSPKTYFKRKRLGVLNVFGALVGAMAFNYLFRHQLDPIVFVIFIANLFVIEMAIQIRWRMSLICHECGFDPVVYKRNPELACQMVKAKIDLRKADPIKATFYPLALPKRKQVKPPAHLANASVSVSTRPNSEISAL
tara:strand:- start:13179 stop:13619 length:441 start_codon:yes stop_codon:yes gene_type:complete